METTRCMASLSDAQSPLVTVAILSFVAVVWCVRTKNRMLWIWTIALAASVAFWIAAEIAPGLAAK